MEWLRVRCVAIALYGRSGDRRSEKIYLSVSYEPFIIFFHIKVVVLQSQRPLQFAGTEKRNEALERSQARRSLHRRDEKICVSVSDDPAIVCYFTSKSVVVLSQRPLQFVGPAKRSETLERSHAGRYWKWRGFCESAAVCELPFESVRLHARHVLGA